MKALINKIRVYLLKKLSTKTIIATKLEKVVLRNDRVHHISIGYYELPGRKFGTVFVTYDSGPRDHFDYDDLEMMQRDYTYVVDVFMSQTTLAKKVKNG